jgi:hypothetical protein
MGNRFPVVRDIFDRLWRTFVQAVLAVAITDGINLQSVLDLETWKTYGLAGVAACLSLIMSLLATRVGKIRGQANSASFDPAVKLQPVDGSVTP